jgi:hypothetical protein
MKNTTTQSETKTTDLDTLTRTYTAFGSFAQMIGEAGTSYFPTLTDQGTKPLADAYDLAMEARGDTRRAWRGAKRRAA